MFHLSPRMFRIQKFLAKLNNLFVRMKCFATFFDFYDNLDTDISPIA